VTRRLALALVGVMLAMVIGQEIRLQGVQRQPVTQIRLHESRLVAFLQEIRDENPNTYDSTLLNLARLRDAQAQVQDVRAEEAVVAEQLIMRLTGQVPGSGAAASRPAP
jgi:hypothetical protein